MFKALTNAMHASIFKIETATKEEVWPCFSPTHSTLTLVPDSSCHARVLFAARLIQARKLRGLSQRALGDLMGLGKEKGSSRINRYEHQVTAIGFDNLEKLAEILRVPVAYLLAETSQMADAILALSGLSRERQTQLTEVLDAVAEHPETIEAILDFIKSGQGSGADR